MQIISISMSGSLLDVKSHIKDLGHLQVFVYPISDISGELYHRIYNFLRDNSSLLVLPPKGLTSNPGLVGPVRALYNFQRHLAPWSYSVKYNKFMSHKQLSGLVGVAQCSELSQVQAIHETVYSISNCYKGAICHSICLVFCTTEVEMYSPITDFSPAEDPESGLSFKQSLEEAFSRLNSSGIEYILINISDRARDDSFDDFINYNKLEEVLSCFTLVLNSTLESRRQTQIKLLQTENFESMNKLKSPFEEPDVEVKDKKLLMKRYKARVFKHIADLTLQCGRHEEALHYYTTAAEQLRVTQDWIWMGAACEGLAATAYIRDMKQLKTTTLISPGSDTPISFSGSLFNLRDSVEMLALDEMERGGALDDLSDTNSIGDKGSFGVEAINTALMPDLTKPIELKRDFIGSKFIECVTYYKKAGISGSIPQMEALLKLARYLIEQKRKLDAHTQLRRIMEIQCSLDGVLKMELLSGIAEIYREIGFNRLAGIYYKWAVTCSGKETTLEYANKAYRMLELALPGYNLDIRNGCVQTSSGERGWPVLQSQILYLMFNIARRTKKESLTFRYLHLLLNNYSPYMYTDQVKNLFNRYKKRIDLIKRENQEHSHKYQLSCIPRVSCFRPSPLLPDLLPKFNLDIKSAAEKFSSKNDSSTHVFWIQHHNCPTNVTVFNFLPIELNITNMRLITTGPECELSKTGVYLPPFCDSHSFDLPCKPIQEGSLRILGYSYELFEIEHQVIFPHHKPYLEVDVLPYLPMLATSVNFPSELLDGEILEDFEITIEAKEGITTYLEANFEWPAGAKEYLQVTLDKSVINRLLPLTPDTTRALPITLQVGLPSKDRLVPGDRSISLNTMCHIRSDSIISNTSAQSQSDTHNQVLCTPTSDTGLHRLFKPVKQSTQRNVTILSSLISEEKGVLSSLKRPRRVRTGSLSKNAPNTPEVRTPELSRLGKKTQSISNIVSSSSKSDPASSSTTNLRDQEEYSMSASKESLDSLDKDYPLQRPIPKLQLSKRSSITVQDDYPDAAPVASPPTTAMPRSVSQHSFNTAFQSKFSSFPEKPKSCIVEGEVQIKYSGELSHEQGYYREYNRKISFKINPSLLFGYFDIIPFPGNPRMCSFCFSVFNLSKDTLVLTCAIKQKSVHDDLESNKEVTLFPQSCKRLQIDIWKLHLAKPMESNNWEFQEYTEYAQLLAKLIKLTWKLLDEHDVRYGETSLQGFQLTPNMLVNLKSEPIWFDIQVNDNIILPDYENKFLTGQQTQLSIILSNYSNVDIGPISVILKIYEDNIESIDSETTGRAAVWPTSNWTINKLPLQSRKSIDCNIIFFYHGTYRLRVITTKTDISPPEDGTIQAHTCPTHKHQVQELSYKMITDMNQLYFNQHSYAKPLVSPQKSNPQTEFWSSTNFWLSSPFYTFNLYHKNFMV